jgi:hypothetical protein
VKIAEVYREGLWTIWITLTRNELRQMAEAPAGVNVDINGNRPGGAAGVPIDSRIRLTVTETDDQGRGLQFAHQHPEGFTPPPKLPRFGTEPPPT